MLYTIRYEVSEGGFANNVVVMAGSEEHLQNGLKLNKSKAMEKIRTQKIEINIDGLNLEILL